MKKRISAFTKPGEEEVLTEKVAHSRASLGGGGMGFDYPATLRGSTANFQVYYDASLGANGTAAADAVLATCEADFATLKSYFGGIVPPVLPIQVIVAPLDATGNGGGGAYHANCSSGILYCDVKTVPAFSPDYTRLLVIAEETEVFEAAQGTGWNCGGSNGEGLSRVFAEIMYPNGIQSWMYSAPTWLDSATRPDFIGTTDPTDRNYTSTGCAVLFLYYLHVQRGYSWAQIAQASGTTLELTYQTLTGSTGAYSTFTSFLQTFYPIGTPSGLTKDDPFPLGKVLKEHKDIKEKEKDFKEFKEHKDIKEKEKEHKEIKEKDKDIKEIKEHKDIKEKEKEHKEIKEQIKDFKEVHEKIHEKGPKEVKEKDKDAEGPQGNPNEFAMGADIIRRLTDRIDNLEKQVASGRAFIRPEERPDVGQNVIKKGKKE